MKYLCIADLHCFRTMYLDVISKADSDFECILLLGDVSESYFINIKEIFPSKRILAVLGNHDYPYLFSRHDDYIDHVHGVVHELDSGIKIGGIGGSYRYKDCDFPCLSQAESISLAYSMPEADILISHTSPFGMHQKDDDAHSGLLGINHYIERYNPLVHIHGHQHENISSILGNTYIFGIFGISILDLGTHQITNLIEG